jgi:hypothetical protein
MFEQLRRWFALDFDGHPWWIVAAWLLVAQAVLILLPLMISTWWLQGAAYMLLVSMALFAGHVYQDAKTIGIPRAGIWVAAVVFLPPLGSILYAYHRYQLHRMVV